MILSAIAERLKRRSKDDFKGRHFQASLIVQAVSWYLRYPLSYRGIEELFLDRGLADYEIRSRHGWYRYITLAMLALAFLAAMRVKLKAAATGMASGKKGQPEPDLWSISARMKSGPVANFWH